MSQSPEVPPGLGDGSDGGTVRGLQQALGSGALTSARLTAFYTDRIRRLDPGLHTVITVNPGAAGEAEASDAARASGRPLGALDGIPVLVKDNIQVSGMPTTAGSPALSGAGSADAFCVTQLRRAGAVIVGKANLSEWANFRSTHSTSGWSTLGGQAANPRGPGRNPSGSSSGSAAAVAAGLVPLAVGTETDGSIVCPASACGIVGIKPTAGLVSRSGIVPISPVQDTAGPMAASVADAAVLLSALAAIDPADPASAGSGLPGRQLPGDYTAFLDEAALDGARIGVWRAGSDDAGRATLALLDAAVTRLRQAGATVLDPVELPGAEQIEGPEFTALLHEFKHALNSYLATLPGDHPATLAELIAYNSRHASTVLARYGQEIFERAEALSGNPADPGLVTARGEAGRLARAALDTPLAEGRLDAVVALTANPACLTDYVLGDHDVFHTSTPAAVAGYPTVSVPAGLVPVPGGTGAGLPVGLSFIGSPWTEPRLIALAHAFECTAARIAAVPRTLGGS